MHKIDRIGMARHLLATETTNSAALDLTGGGGITGQSQSARPVNAALYKQGNSFSAPTGSPNLPASSSIIIGQQIGILPPDANAYGIEVWGEMDCTIATAAPNTVGVTPVAAMPSALAAANALIGCNRTTVLGATQLNPATRMNLFYHTVVVANFSPLVGIIHGFRLHELGGAVRVVQINYQRFGFRTLESQSDLDYYDPVR